MKKTYLCPMHLEIKQEKPGRCSKCGMDLVLEEHVKNMNRENSHGSEKITWKNYIPLMTVIGIILLSTITFSIRDINTNVYRFPNTISYFMIGFFMAFSTFKLIDLKGFAQGYSTYDLLAKKWFSYGYSYPFLELFFAFSMILFPQSKTILFLEFLVMTFSGVGVLIKLLKHEKFQCACLGTFLKVPLTKITLIEDFGMAGLAGFLLLTS